MTASSLWSYTDPSTQLSPFHTPCVQSGSAPYPQPTFSGMPMIGSISSVDVLPSRLVRSIDACVGLRVPDVYEISGSGQPELLRIAAGRGREHAHREVRVARTELVLFEDDVQREVVEAQRDPAPPHAGELVRAARGLGFADGPDAPRPVAGRGEPLGRDRDQLAVDAHLAFERADAREPRRVEQDLVALAANVRGFRDRSVLGAVLEIERDAVLSRRHRSRRIARNGSMTSMR